MIVRGLLVGRPPHSAKTRLADRLGRARATALASAMLHDVWERIALAGLPRVLAADGPVDAYGLPRGPADGVWDQGSGPLHTRLEALTARAHAQGEIALLVGGDAPDVPTALLRAAADAAPSHAGVFVAAHDGGFVAAAFRVAVDLTHVRWSTPDALADATAATRLVGSAAVVGRHFDVDDVEDLERLGPCRTADLWRAR